MNYGSEFRNKSPSVNQREDEEVADGISDNSSRLTKDGFPQLCEQRDNICQIKWYNDVCLRKTYTIKHWLKRGTRNMGGVARPTSEWKFSNQHTTLELLSINSEVTRLLEIINSNNRVHSTRGLRK